MVTLQAAIAAMALSGISQTMLLDFYSDSCGPCREMNPTVQALIDAGYPVQRVNVAQNPRLAAKYGVRSIPCFVMVVKGREVDREVGRTSLSRLQQMCQLGASAAAPSRLGQMLAKNGATRTPPIPPTPLAPPVDPWAAPAAVQPIPVSPMPLKAPTSGASDAALLAASVRLRVEDPDGRSCGSGTIIDNRNGDALVLTCGHIFRDSQGKGTITVDLFGSGEPQQAVGHLVSYNLDRDVGLVWFHPPGPVAVARLAPPEYRIEKGMPVASVGCNQGDPPTVRRSQVVSSDESQKPPCLWVAGQPVEGRSGGGLFSSEGYVIGVCNAADPSREEGYFAARASIYAELDRHQLAFVYKSPVGTLGGMPATPGPAAGMTDLASLGSPPHSAESAVVAASATEPISNLRPHEQAALEEIRRREKEGAEVIIVVHPRGNPDGKSDVILVENASQGMVKQLYAEGRRADQPYHTSMELPNPRKELSGPRKVVLEWSLPPGAPAPNPPLAAKP
jgi:thiol-disulfide isomerase/thioredoxin